MGASLRACVLLLLGVSGLAAQDGSITGRVMKSGDGSPIEAAIVSLAGSGKKTKTDQAGRFAFTGLRTGTYSVAVSVLGASPLGAMVQLGPGEVKTLEFRVDSIGQLLPEIVVEGRSDPVPLQPLNKFERRMAFGNGGRFITQAEIERRNPIRLTDMFRYVPGVRMICVQFNCAVRLNSDVRQCPPSVYVDEQRVGVDMLGMITPQDVYGVEIFRGPSETPPELNDELARCGGAIQIWTKRHRR